MRQGIEHEFKLFLPSEAALEAVLARLGAPAGPPEVQTNHFFDTPSRDLRRARLALRLRHEAGTHTLTLKGPSLQSDALSATRPEEELEIAPDQAADVLAGNTSALELLARSAGASPLVARARAASAGAPLRTIGSFVNHRQRVGPLEFPPRSGAPALVFELDRTEFPDGSVQRELEVELPADAPAGEIEAGLARLFAELGLPLRGAESKAARFFRLLDARAAGPA